MLVLASQSPSRQKLLSQLYPSFSIDPAHLDETPLPREKPSFYVTRMAKEKAAHVAQRHFGKYVLGADTIVSVGTRILTKAADLQEAQKQMNLLSGRRHRVYTALALITPQEKIIQRLAVTHVAFKVLTLEEKEAFLASEEWKNVSVYRHEGIAASFIRMMRGLPSTIAGLPLFDTAQLLRGQGLISGSP